MILVHDQKGTYVGRLRKTDFLRYTGLKKMPSTFHAYALFEFFYEHETFRFFTIPFTKSKATLHVIQRYNQYFLHDRTCKNCLLCTQD